MSQKDLAEKLGVAQSYVSRVEAGLENVSLSTCQRFAGAVGMTYSGALVFSFTTLEVKYRGLENVTLSTCERFAHGVGGVYSSDFTPLSQKINA